MLSSLVFFFAAVTGQVPVVSSEFFAPGRSWTWDYSHAQTGELYSTETYTVVDRAADLVTIEMSTIFPGQGAYRAHHRLIVPVDRCLAAYRNPVQKQPWSFRMFYREQDGHWQETEPPTTLAFEEKFNCNPWINDSRSYLTIFRDGVNGAEFMHKLWRTVETSWFSGESVEAGVMSEKRFNHGNGSQNYIVRRR